jgi:hypothetical protein
MSATETTLTVEYELSSRRHSQNYNEITKRDLEIERGLSQFELSQPYSRVQDETTVEPVTQELKPVDRGRDAWCTLLGAFAFDALFWGKSHQPRMFFA